MFEIIVTILLVLLVLIVYFQEKRIKTMTEGLYNLSLSQQYSIEASKIQNDFNQALSDSHTHNSDKLDRVEYIILDVGKTLDDIIERIEKLESKSDGGVADMFSGVISHNKTTYKKGEQYVLATVITCLCWSIELADMPSCAISRFVCVLPSVGSLYINCYYINIGIL